MAIRKEKLINGEIYHVIIRGVEGRLIFMDDEDRWRGIFSLYEFNNVFPVTIRRQRQLREQIKAMIKSGRSSTPAELDKRDKLVEILAFVFMPNHIHILLRQIKPDGISIFMQKIGSGYTNFFNRKYQREGHLFQGKFRFSHVSGGEYLKTVFVYIQTNPVSLIEPEWKEKGIEDPERAIVFLEGYRWSSYLDYLGKENFPSLTDREFFGRIFKNPEIMKMFIDSRVSCKKKPLINDFIIL
jgi:putative transposase